MGGGGGGLLTLIKRGYLGTVLGDSTVEKEVENATGVLSGPCVERQAQRCTTSPGLKFNSNNLYHMMLLITARSACTVIQNAELQVVAQ